MAINKHITKEDFFKLLEKRLGEYRIAILGVETSSQLAMSMLRIKSMSIERMKELDSNSNLFGTGFWGYGINTVCDGNESHSHFDVEEIKKIGELNKHSREYRKCLALTFKIEDGFFFFFLFSIDTCRMDFNYTVHTKYDLKNFSNARQKKRKDKIFVEFIFNGLEKPILFQVETYSTPFGGSKEQIAQYYIDSIIKLANDAKSEKVDTAVAVKEDFNKPIDRVELALRDLIVEQIRLKTGKEEYTSIITGADKGTIKNRIQKFVDAHPNKKVEDFKMLKEAIQFTDIEHLKKIVLADEYWPFFEPAFKDKLKVEKHFNGFRDLRHPVKHSREVTRLIELEGKAAMEWIGMAIKLQ